MENLNKNILDDEIVYRGLKKIKKQEALKSLQEIKESIEMLLSKTNIKYYVEIKDTELIIKNTEKEFKKVVIDALSGLKSECESKKDEDLTVYDFEIVYEIKAYTDIQYYSNIFKTNCYYNLHNLVLGFLI